MRVAVLGAGNGGVASAFDFAQHGHDVALFATPEYDDNVLAVAEAGGITATGDLEGFAPVRYRAPTSRRRWPAPSSSCWWVRRTARSRWRARPVRTSPTAWPSWSARLLRRRDRVPARRRARARRRALVVGETSTLPYAVRVTEPGVVNVFLKLRTGVYLSGLPRSGTERLHELVREVWPAVERAESVFQTTLQNGNPVIHPAVTLLNAGLLERTGGDFLFYEDGVTESVGRLIEAVDAERLAIAAALGVTILSDPALGARQGYMREENYSTGYSRAPGFLGIRAQSRLDHRYLTEDVGYSLVFMSDLAARLGVPTPVMDAVIRSPPSCSPGTSVRRASGPSTLGLDGMSREALAAL